MSYEQLSQMMLIGDPDTITRQMEEQVAAGVNYFIFYIPRIAYEREPFQRLTEQVLSRFQ